MGEVELRELVQVGAATILYVIKSRTMISRTGSSALRAAQSRVDGFEEGMAAGRLTALHHSGGRA